MSDSSTIHDVACNLCGGTRVRLICVEKSFPIGRCRECGLIYVTRRMPNELGDTRYWKDDLAPDDLSFERNKWSVYEAGLLGLRRLGSSGGRLLDVGCAFGTFLDQARRAGWEPFGVDISDVAVRHARERKGLARVERKELASAAYPDRYFEAASLWNVLEHVPDPSATLREVHRVLADGGLVLVRVPNMLFHGALRRSTPALRLLGVRTRPPYLGGVAPPHHLFGFTPRTLRAMLRRAGLDVAGIVPAVHHREGRPLVRTLEAISRAIHVASVNRFVVSPTLIGYGRKP